MAGMLFSGDKTFLSFAIATMMVVGVAMIGSLTVLPAMLSKLGDRVEKGRIPFLHRLPPRRRGESRFWGAILDPASSATRSSRPSPRRPCSLVAGAPGAPSAHRRSPGSTRCRRACRPSSRSHAIQDAFPGGRIRRSSRSRPTPDVARVRSGDRRARSARRSPAARCTSPIRSTSSRDGTVTTVAIPLAGNGTDDGLEPRARDAAQRASCPPRSARVAGRRPTPSPAAPPRRTT